MANDFKNTSLVTKFAVKEFLNALVMGQKVDRQLDTSKVFSGKVGATASIRRPVMFEAIAGSAISIQDIEEGIVPVSLDQRPVTMKHIEKPQLLMELKLNLKLRGKLRRIMSIRRTENVLHVT